LGSGWDAFIEPLHKRAPKDAGLGGIECIRSLPLARPLTVHKASGRGNRDVAIAAAFRSGGYAVQQVVEDCGVHQSTVSRAEKMGEGAG